LSQERLYQHPAMRTLRRAIMRELRLQFVASIVLLAIGSGLCIATFKISVVFSVIGLGVSMIAGKLVVDTAANLRIDNHFLLNYLRYQPQHVVWVYSLLAERAPMGLQFLRKGTLHFRLDNGSEFSVGLPAHQLKLVSKFLIRLLPHATFGYSTDLEYLYRVSPERLRRDQDQGEDYFF